MEVFPEDGRPYVSLGKLLVQQRRYDEALALYEEGCTATGAPGGLRACTRAPCPAAASRPLPPRRSPPNRSANGVVLRLHCRPLPPPGPRAGGTNAHIWAAWAYLAAKLNNVGLARKLYDAAIVANPQHAAAWHGWGLLEKEQGNYLR